MSVIAVALKHLIAAGVTGDALVTAVTEMETEISLTPYRSSGAIRQDRYRRNKASQNVTSVTSDTASPNGFNGFSDSSLTSLTPIKENPPIGGQKKVSQQGSKPSTRGTRLNRDWELPQEWGEWAEKQSLSGQEIINEGAKFRDWWVSKAGAGGLKVDWEATWRNWIRKYLEDKSNAIQTKRFK